MATVDERHWATRAAVWAVGAAKEFVELRLEKLRLDVEQQRDDINKCRPIRAGTRVEMRVGKSA